VKSIEKKEKDAGERGERILFYFIPYGYPYAYG
jgi:hypothetical protein